MSGWQLYVGQHGDTVKIGISANLRQRYRQHRGLAKLAGVTFTPLFALPPHAEAEANEQAILARFQRPNTRSEYLTADADEVIAFIRTLPCTPTPEKPRHDESARWVTTAEAAEILGVARRTVGRYSLAGHLPRYRRSAPDWRPTYYRIEDVHAFGGMAVPERAGTP